MSIQEQMSKPMAPGERDHLSDCIEDAVDDFFDESGADRDDDGKLTTVYVAMVEKAVAWLVYLGMGREEIDAVVADAVAETAAKIEMIKHATSPGGDA